MRKLALQRADRIALTPIVLGELGAGFRIAALVLDTQHPAYKAVTAVRLR